MLLTNINDRVRVYGQLNFQVIREATLETLNQWLQTLNQFLERETQNQFLERETQNQFLGRETQTTSSRFSNPPNLRLDLLQIMDQLSQTGIGCIQILNTLSDYNYIWNQIGR